MEKKSRYSKITEKEYRQIANKAHLWPTDVYVEFMQKRFPKEFDRNYAEEWATRFKSGDPTAYMDLQSVRAYMEAVKKIRGVV
jgi:hypothetical protein